MVRKSKEKEGTVNCPFLSKWFHTAGVAGLNPASPTIAIQEVNSLLLTPFLFPHFLRLPFPSYRSTF
jgi:hypothetical protein